MIWTQPVWHWWFSRGIPRQRRQSCLRFWVLRLLMESSWYSLLRIYIINYTFLTFCNRHTSTLSDLALTQWSVSIFFGFSTAMVMVRTRHCSQRRTGYTRLSFITLISMEQDTTSHQMFSCSTCPVYWGKTHIRSYLGI